MKSEKNIERDLFAFVKESELAAAVNGDVYRLGTRPDNSTKEDIVVKFISGTDGQIQRGIIVLDVYVPDIKITSGKLVENMQRIEVLENLIYSFLQDCNTTEYLYSLDATPKSLEAEEIGQHFIYARIAYQRISE